MFCEFSSGALDLWAFVAHDVLHPSFFKSFSEIRELADREIVSGWSIADTMLIPSDDISTILGSSLARLNPFRGNRVRRRQGALDLSSFPRHRIEPISITNIFFMQKDTLDNKNEVSWLSKIADFFWFSDLTYFALGYIIILFFKYNKSYNNKRYKDIN